MFIPVCVSCFLFVLSFLVWFFLWLPEEVLTLLFFLHCENGDFSILMKDTFFSLVPLSLQNATLKPVPNLRENFMKAMLVCTFELILAAK